MIKKSVKTSFKSKSAKVSNGLLKKEPYSLLFGDCYKMLTQIETSSVDLILTDPPYNLLGTWHSLLDPLFDTFQIMVWHKTNPPPKIRRAGSFYGSGIHSSGLQTT